jgi:hypothetical protein
MKDKKGLTEHRAAELNYTPINPAISASLIVQCSVPLDRDYKARGR